MKVKEFTFWEWEVARLEENKRTAREELMLLSRQDVREEEEENDDDGDTDDIEQNMSEHTNPNEDVDSEPEWIDIPVLGAEAIQGNEVAAVESEPYKPIEVYAGGNVNQEGEASASVKGRMSDKDIRKTKDSVIRKRRKNRMEDAVTVQTLPISEDEIREGDSCGTISRRKGRKTAKKAKTETLGNIISRCTSTANGGGPLAIDLTPSTSTGGGPLGNNLSPTSSTEGAPLGTGFSPMTSSGGAPMEISLSPSTSTEGDTLGMNMDPLTSNGGGAPVNDLNSSNSSGGFALGFDLNELPPDQVEDWISPEPTAAESHAEGEVQGTSVNDQTVSSSKGKDKMILPGDQTVVQSEASQCVQKEHSNAESSIVEPKRDEAGRTVVHSDHRTQDGEQMFQIVNGKLPLPMPGSPTQRPSILLRGSGRQGHIASGNQGNRAYGRNAASGTTDPLVRNLHRSTIEAQRTVGTSSNLNKLPMDQVVETEDWISTEPPAAENRAGREVRSTSVIDQTVSSCKGKGKVGLPGDHTDLPPYALFLQSETSRCVQQGHNNAESSIVQTEKVGAGRTVLHSDHRTRQNGEQMFQFANGKLPLPLPESPTHRLLRGSGGERGNRASGNAASERAGLNGATDPLVRKLYEPALSTFEPQPTLGRSSNYYGNQSLSYTSTQEIAATRAPNFPGCSSGAGAYQRSALPSSSERPLSGSHFPLGVSSWSGRGGHQQLHGLVGGSSSISQPVSQESWKNSETLSYRSQPPAGSLANKGQRFSQSCFGTSQGFQTSQSSMSQNSLYYINQCLRMGLETSMRSPPQHIYSGTDRRVHPNASPPTDMLRYRTPVHVDWSNNIHQLSSMPHDYHRLDMSRLAHSRSNGPLFPQSTSSYLNGDNYPGSFTGMSPVPQANSASFPSTIWPPAIPVPVWPPAIPGPEVNHAQGIDVCLTNENPAEFNTTEIRNKHMTGYGDVQ